MAVSVFVKASFFGFSPSPFPIASARFWRPASCSFTSLMRRTAAYSVNKSSRAVFRSCRQRLARHEAPAQDRQNQHQGQRILGAYRRHPSIHPEPRGTGGRATPIVGQRNARLTYAAKLLPDESQTTHPSTQSTFGLPEEPRPPRGSSHNWVLDEVGRDSPDQFVKTEKQDTVRVLVDLSPPATDSQSSQDRSAGRHHKII